MREFSL